MQAAQELWFKLGLPVVPSMLVSRQNDLFTQYPRDRIEDVA